MQRGSTPLQGTSCGLTRIFELVRGFASQVIEGLLSIGGLVGNIPFHTGCRTSARRSSWVACRLSIEFVHVVPPIFYPAYEVWVVSLKHVPLKTDCSL